jgi:GDP-L-fucose synthase
MFNGAAMGYWGGKSVLVTGGSGFLGHHVIAALRQQGCGEIFVAKSKDYDLIVENDVRRLFDDHQPDIVFHLAGLVGGILPNQERPAEFFYKNLMMGTLVTHYAWKAGAKKLVAAGAGCGYPENAPIPLKESSFWDGFPQKESAPYSLAKRLLSIQSLAYYQQYNFVSVICIPGNIYGPWDNFNLLEAHVIPALVRKFVEAKLSNAPTVEIWGTGKPSRDFVYAGDVARGMLAAVEIYEKNEVVNLSSGVETTIREVVQLLQEITGYAGEITWNSKRPDGQLRRCFDMSKAKTDLGFEAKTDIGQGLAQTVDWYRKNLYNPELRK